MSIDLSPDPEQAPDTREKIIDAALNEFAESGFSGARVDRIAERAGVNKAMLYYHFGPKKKLYIEVLRIFMERAAVFFKRGATAQTGFAEMLSGVVEAHAQFFRTQHRFRKIMLREMADPTPEVLDALAAALRSSALPKIFLSHYKAAVEKGEVRDLDVRQVLSLFIGASISYYIMAPLFNRIMEIENTDEFIEKRKQAIVDILLHGIRVK